jgi:small-conductance mechanosensitive channel
VDFISNPRVQLVAVMLAVTVLFSLLVRSLHKWAAKRISQNTEADSAEKRLGHELVEAGLGPLCLLVWYYGLFLTADIAAGDLAYNGEWAWLHVLLSHVAGLGLFIAGFWFFYGAAKVLDVHFRAHAAKTPGKLDDVLLPTLGLTLRLLAPIIALMLFVHAWPLSPESLQFARKILAIALIGSATWIVRRAVLLAETTILDTDVNKTGNYQGRALATRVQVLRKIAMVLITVFAFAAVLMLFDEVRDLGRSILASAGVAGIILGLAAQRSLGNLFAGLQIALTQPVRIGDQIKIENEVGFVEEITLTYVVVRIWDLRRLIVPISYFIEQPVQNWTRNSSNLLSPVGIRVDFSFPVDTFRAHMQEVISQSPYWDKVTFNVQVTGSDHQSMEVRVLGSADSPGNSGNLQCELREKMIDYVHRNYPQCLPKAREEGKPMQEWRTSEEYEARHWPSGPRPAPPPAPTPMDAPATSPKPPSS